MAAEKLDTYQRVTDAIIARLDAGVVPWRQPWVSFRAMSVSSGKAYRGLNTLLLAMAHEDGGYSSPYWATYRKLKEMGAQVRKGEKGHMVTFWKFLEIFDKETGEKKRIPFLRGYSVFNVDQADWPDGKAPAKFYPGRQVVDPIAEAEAAILAYTDGQGPEVRYGGDRACYSPSKDLVLMPERDQFLSSEAFYAVHFHELIHSTGHTSRLAREGVVEGARFGSPVYSREELVAELGAAMLSATVGLEAPEQLDQRAAYIASWRKALTDDPKALVWAAGRAQRAADHVLGEEITEGQVAA